MAMMATPRYRNQTLADLQFLVLDPLVRDRIAIAYQGDREKNELADVAGFAIWASVSAEVDQRIREQIRAGAFPVRLRPGDWASGDINWLLDVIAPNAKLTAAVLANFGTVVKGGGLLRLHPIISRLVDAEILEEARGREAALRRRLMITWPGGRPESLLPARTVRRSRCGSLSASRA
jgi:hemolysin-activating ACP:hemolysin acyltransferase